LTEAGFKTLKDYTKALVSRFQGSYSGHNRVQIGVAQFGNGELAPDGKTVSAALPIQALTSDKSKAVSAVEGLTFKKGFTNMAQVFATAEDMFTQGSRKGAQQAVLVVTDGKPSFSFETQSMVKQLDDKNILRYFVVINDVSADVQRIKQWASQPWETNFLHVTDLDQNDNIEDNKPWVQQALTKFCPQAFSPSRVEKREHRGEYIKLYSGGYCSSTRRWRRSSFRPFWYRGSRDQAIDKCKKLAKSRSHTIFLLRNLWHRHPWHNKRWYCWTGQLDITPTQYESWFEDRTQAACPGGRWNRWPGDYYALKPKDPKGCSELGFKKVPAEYECNRRKMWHWTGTSHQWNENDWTTENAEEFGGADACVFHASTNGKTCKEFCTAEYGKTCVRGTPDAEQQVDNLQWWLQGQGKAGTMCSVGDEAFKTQKEDENGCLQEWDHQICACK
jgi:hypothetical protein